MKFDKPIADNENLIEVDKTSFGYTVTHKKGKKVLFTASYDHESEAVRTATKMAKYLQSSNEVIWYCLNYAFDKKK
jgi:hypothetical protein